MVYAQGGAISSPRTAATDQPTVRMSSATACMQASGSRPAPSASASHSLARRLRGGFMDDTLRGGYDISGASRVHAEAPLDRAQPAVDRVQQGLDLTGRLRAPHPHLQAHRCGVLQAFRLALDLLDHPLAELPQVRPEPAENLDGHAVVLSDQPEEQVASADVLADPRRLPQRELEALLGPRRERDVPGRPL